MQAHALCTMSDTDMICAFLKNWADEIDMKDCRQQRC